MILLIIGLLILLYSFINYKKAFMLFIVYQIFWYYNVSLFSVAGKTLTAAMGFTGAFYLLYFFKHRKYIHPKTRLPYMLPLMLMLISALATCFSSLAGFSSELTRCLSTRIFPYIVMVWLMWQLLETEEDFKFLFKMITIVMFLGCLLGFYEYLTHTNFLFDMKNSLAGGGLYNYNTSSNSSATMRGYRLMALFEHPLTAGMAFGLYSSFVFAITINENKTIPFHRLAVITALLGLPCIILTKMRSVFVFIVIAAFGVINVRKKKFYQIVLLMIVGGLVVWPLVKDQLNLILSIFDSSLQDSVGGSSLAMRLSQFDAVLRVMRISPAFGLGESFERYINNSLLLGTMSFESVWFEQMAKHGMLGVITYVILAIYSIGIVPFKYKKKELFYVSLAYWITISITGETNFRIFLYYLPLIYFIKSSTVYREAKPSYKAPINLTIKTSSIQR